MKSCVEGRIVERRGEGLFIDGELCRTRVVSKRFVLNIFCGNDFRFQDICRQTYASGINLCAIELKVVLTK